MNIRCFLMAAGLLVAGAASASVPIDGRLSSEDQARILAIGDLVDDHWNARRAEDLAALYVEEGDLQFVGQDRGARSRAGIADYFSASFARLTPDLRHVTKVDRLKVLTPDAVLADSSVELLRQAPDGSTSVVRRFATTNILVRESGEWRIAAVRTHILPDPTAVES